MGSHLPPIVAFGVTALLGAAAGSAADIPSNPFSSPPIMIIPPAPTHPSAEETKDRLDADRMEQLAGPAIMLARAGDLSAGARALEQLLTASNAQTPLLQADLLESFGALLVIGGMRDNKRALIAFGIPYLARAIPAYENAFGAIHPETALALQTYADSEIALDPVNPPLAVIAAVERVHDIRQRTLGPANFETLAARMHLRELQGLPSVTARDPAKVKAAIDDLRRIIKAIGETNVYQPTEVKLMAMFDIAIIHLNNGQIPQALMAAKTAWDAMATLPSDACGQYQYVPSHWLEAVEAHPNVATAAAALRGAC